jgi:G3E family GTPase
VNPTRAHVITGSFGSGKTTAIRWLMAHKPAEELWVVILNEFTDAGIDALKVAESSRGNYDVRLVAGGCLCCVGELEFGKQLRDLLRNFKPARLLIEPSGAGHAADIVDTLALYEAQQALGLWAVQWMLPRELVFARAVIEPRLSWLLEADQGWLRRMKGVFRTGLGPSWLVQARGRGLEGEDSAFRRDSRVELVLSAAPTDAYLDPWRSLLRDAANPPRS